MMKVAAPLIAGLLMLGAAPSAPASSFAGTSAGASSGGSSASTGSTSGDDKIILQAREDVAGFVASEGRLRTARFEAALHLLRERDALAREATDMQIALAILAR